MQGSAGKVKPKKVEQLLAEKQTALEDKIDHDWKNRENYHPDDESVVDW